MYISLPWVLHLLRLVEGELSSLLFIFLIQRFILHLLFLVFIMFRPSPLATELGQILERCYKDSRAVDTESLCIIAREKVEVKGGVLIGDLIPWWHM